MKRPDDSPGQADRGSKPPPALYFVPHRPARVDRRLLPPLLILSAAAVLITYRIATPDWHWDLAAARRPEMPSPTPRPAKPPAPVPKSPAVAARPAAPKEGPDAVARAAMDDIHREAERERARLEESERLKAEEGRRLAAEARRNPQPEPGPGRFGPAQPGLQFHVEMDERMAAQRRQFEAMVRDHQEFHRRQMAAMFDRHRAFLAPMPGTPQPDGPAMPDARAFSMTVPPGGGVQYEMHWEFRSNGP